MQSRIGTRRVKILLAGGVILALVLPMTLEHLKRVRTESGLEEIGTQLTGNANIDFSQLTADDLAYKTDIGFSGSLYPAHGIFIDPWGNRVEVEYQARSSRLILSTAGPDGMEGTGDDIRHVATTK